MTTYLSGWLVLLPSFLCGAALVFAIIRWPDAMIWVLIGVMVALLLVVAPYAIGLSMRQ